MHVVPDVVTCNDITLGSVAYQWQVLLTMFSRDIVSTKTDRSYERQQTLRSYSLYSALQHENQLEVMEGLLQVFGWEIQEIHTM